MLNMSSPVVQNLMQTGFNPYMNNGYIPQQNIQYQQPNYNNGYNPYIMNQQRKNEINLDEMSFYYDPMPQVIVNDNRGINTQREINTQNNYYNNPYNNYFNQNMFNGYSNPILMRNQEEVNRIRQREEAIEQGKIWRVLFKKEQKNDENFDIEGAVHAIESLYYSEPIQQEIPFKDRMIIDKNNHFGELEGKLEYCRQNNIPIRDYRYEERCRFYGYYNHINSIIGNDDCDMVEYFTKVYPELKYEQLSYEAQKYNKNLKNKYSNKDFNNLLDKSAVDKSDSYYYKIMESFAEDGVKLETSNGLVITPDQMEIKLPERLLKKREERYYQQRAKFYDTIFGKKEV